MALILSYLLPHAPGPRIILVYHLLRVANTEVESNVLKSAIQVESIHLWFMVGKQ